ncbi:Phototropin-2 [Dissostichus eleginoides]|uniref:Phototropin-2 n=1 Tax=Dissostichus eleginoides TaxID=100907 RepID=A0AAD9CGZ8_DISEL|nr:Phototropin-2 [Dissostichus eleginoides]
MPLHNHIVKEAWTRDRSQEDEDSVSTLVQILLVSDLQNSRCEGKTKGTSPYDIFAETCMSTPDTTQVFGLWIVDSGHT